MKSQNAVARTIFGDQELYFTTDNSQETFQDLSAKVIRDGHNGFDPAGITGYLTFRYPISGNTMFRDYKAVPPGGEIINGTPAYYWHPRFSFSDVSFDVAVEEVRKLLIESIGLLTEGKKKIGITIGGMDSSLICALTRELYPDCELHTYSVGFDGAEDDFAYAQIVAELYNTVHKEIVLSKDDYVGQESLLKPLILRKGAPLHPNEMALAYAERAAVVDGCEIVLCGEGADDIFGGYGQNLRMYMDYTGEIPYTKFLLNNYRYFTLEDRSLLVRDKYLVDDIALLDGVLQSEDAPSDVKDLMFYFIQRVHTVGLITRGANAMRFNGLPPGFPYIYRPLVDYVNSLPFEYKVHWKSARDESEAQHMYFRDISERKDIPKYILKKLAERYLPHNAVYRPKCAFPVPFERWFKNVAEWPLDEGIFRTSDISDLSGWKKFMIINLNTFIEEFKPYQRNVKGG